MNGVQHYLFDVTAGTATPPEGAGMGLLYVGAVLAVIGGSIAAMVARYRSV